jgi:hydrogenase expression/formation protein HypC
MCLAIPSKIVKIDGAEAEVEVGGVVKRANLAFLDASKVGDYVLLHAGFAIQKVDEKEALESLKLGNERN